jgi:TolB-like protein
MLRDRTRLATRASETGAIVLAEKYDGELSALFTLQDTISTQIVTTIAPHVREHERLRAMPARPH